MLKFISLGSGSSGNCYYLYTEKQGLIIDSGVGIRKIKKHSKDYGIDLSKAIALLITHDHADHVKSVGYLSKEYHIDVYATEKVHLGITDNYCVHKKVEAERKKLINYGDSLSIGDFSIRVFGVPHDSRDNVGYEIEHDGVVFCFITDAGHVTDEMKTYIARSNYLVIEANHDEEMLEQGPYPAHLKKRILSETGHLSNLCCAKAVAENMNEHLKHVWLCHLSEENNHPELAKKTVESTLRTYGIIVGKDVELDVLKRKTPSGVYELK
ncbi:MAG: MBL fold metallo-hydrolase [Prevotellaceae bacterium]|nr:MBL fold metallo-hydrolase [Prevotellaceae bacterium]